MLAIDPGTIALGYSVLDPGPLYVACGLLEAPAKWPRWKRLAEMHADLTELVAEYQPTHAALEGGVDRFATAALAGGEARGIVLAVLYSAGIPPERITEHAPAAVKRAVVGKGNATKEAVAAVMRMRLGLRTMPPLDATDALAIGVAALAGAGVTVPKARRPRTRATI